MRVKVQHLKLGINQLPAATEAVDFVILTDEFGNSKLEITFTDEQGKLSVVSIFDSSSVTITPEIKKVSKLYDKKWLMFAHF